MTYILNENKLAIKLGLNHFLHEEMHVPSHKYDICFHFDDVFEI